MCVRRPLLCLPRCVAAANVCLSVCLCMYAAGGSGEANDLQVLVTKLQSDLAKAQAQAADSHQANLTLGTELAVMERKQRNQVSS